MVEIAMQNIFLRAHEVLHPAGAEIAELRRAGVSASRIVILYPYAIEQWLPQLAASLEGAAPGHNLMSRLVGAHTAFTLLSKNDDFGDYLKFRSAAFYQLLELNNGSLLYKILRCGDENMTYGEQASRRDIFSATHELTSLAAAWSRFPQLHAREREFARLLKAGLSALLPDAFTFPAADLVGEWSWGQG